MSYNKSLVEYLEWHDIDEEDYKAIINYLNGKYPPQHYVPYPIYYPRKPLPYPWESPDSINPHYPWTSVKITC